MPKTTRITATSVALLAVLASVAVTGCAAADPAHDTGKTPDTVPVAESPKPSETPPKKTSEFGEAVKSSRGNLIKEVGQMAGTSLPEDQKVIGSRFVVTDIVLDPKCDGEFVDPPKNGHYLAVHLNVETTPELAQSDFPEVWISGHDWQAYDAEGKRLNDPFGNGWTCMSEASMLPTSIGPGQSVSGYIVLDVADPHGVIALTMNGAATGWEWEY